MRIDWRSTYAILTVPGKAYVLFLLFFCGWYGIALIRHSLLIRRFKNRRGKVCQRNVCSIGLSTAQFARVAVPGFVFLRVRLLY